MEFAYRQHLVENCQKIRAPFVLIMEKWKNRRQELKKQEVWCIILQLGWKRFQPKCFIYETEKQKRSFQSLWRAGTFGRSVGGSNCESQVRQPGEYFVLRLATISQPG